MLFTNMLHIHCKMYVHQIEENKYLFVCMELCFLVEMDIPLFYVNAYS